MHGFYSIMLCTGEKFGEIEHWGTQRLLLYRCAKESKLMEGTQCFSSLSILVALTLWTRGSQSGGSPQIPTEGVRASLFFLATVIGAHNFTMVLLRLMFLGECICQLWKSCIFLEASHCIKRLALDSWDWETFWRCPAVAKRVSQLICRHMSEAHVRWSSPRLLLGDTRRSRDELSPLSQGWTHPKRHGHKQGWSFQQLKQKYNIIIHQMP